MSEASIGRRFRDLKTIGPDSSLFRITGCGLLFCFPRKWDEAEGTYLATRCLCLFYLPLIALGTYRIRPTSDEAVVDRVGFRLGAGAYNLVFLLGVAGYVGTTYWRYYTSTPEYQVLARLGQADAFAKEGKLADAAYVYSDIARGPTPSSREAASRLSDILENRLTPNIPVPEAANVLRWTADAARSGRYPDMGPALFRRGMELARERSKADPRGALQTLDVVEPFTPTGTESGKTRLDLLKALVEAHPDEIEWTNMLVSLHETRGEIDACESLLARHRAHLGDTENARILGMIDARKGRSAEALALLEPYIKGRLDRLRGVEDEIKNAANAAQQRILNELRFGARRDFDFGRYEISSKEQKNDMLRDYVMARLKDDPGIRAIEERANREAATVVPAALEVGTLLLQRAQTQADPRAREADLKASEETLLSIGRVAGESDEYKLNLGQVYFWQGKVGAGRELIDGVLTAGGRDPKLLVAVCDIYRELGNETDARALAEEAFGKAADDQVRQHAAIQRGLLSDDLDDRVEWLRKSGSDSPHFRALLAETLARVELRRGNLPEAINHLRESVRLYESLPEVAGALQNKGIALLALGQYGRDPDSLARGIDSIDKAVSLDASNSLTQLSLASVLIQKGAADVLGKSIDFSLLREAANPSHARFLADDAAAMASLNKRLLEDRSIVRAIGIFEKLMLLAPRRDSSYAVLEHFRYLRRDAEALRALLKRLESVELDQSAEIAEKLETYAGRRVAKEKKEVGSSLALAETTLTEARAAGRNITFAVAADSVVRYRVAAEMTGMNLPPDEAVKIAEEALAAAPSFATRTGLATALLLRADRGLASNEPAYAAFVEKARFTCGSSWRVALMMLDDGPTRKAVSGHPDVRRAVDFIREACKADPLENGSGWAWCLLRLDHPDDAANLARALLASEAELLHREISLRLDPVDLSRALESYAAARMAGKDADGAEILKRVAARGVPLPFNPEVGPSGAAAPK